MARDIVCDMAVNEEEAQANGLYTNHSGQTFYFCGKQCKQHFDADPEQFGRDKPAAAYVGKPIAPKK